MVSASSWEAESLGGFRVSRARVTKSAHSPEETVARDFIAQGDADGVVVVCDATCLERNLILVLQVLELTGRVIVCVNLLDEARRLGIEVDLEGLSHRLGVPVLGISAGRNEGLDALLHAVSALPEQDPSPHPPAPSEHRVRLAEQYAVQSIRTRQAEKLRRQQRLDRLLTSRTTGIPLMLLLLGLVLWFTIAGANYPSQLLSGLFSRLCEAARAWLRLAPPWLSSLLVDGVLQVTGWVISVMLPPMAIFFPLFTLLEDLGYLPRVAFVLDHAFQKAKACGKQALTMCMDYIKMQKQCVRRIPCTLLFISGYLPYPVNSLLQAAAPTLPSGVIPFFF